MESLWQAYGKADPATRLRIRLKLYELALLAAIAVVLLVRL